MVMVSIERLQELHRRGCITLDQLLEGADKIEAAGRVPPRSSTARQSHASSSAASEPTCPMEATRPMEEESVRRERPFAAASVTWARRTWARRSGMRCCLTPKGGLMTTMSRTIQRLPTAAS